MLLTQIQNLTDTIQADDICIELEKRYLGTILKVTYNKISKFLLCDSIIKNTLYFNDYLTGRSYSFDITNAVDVEIEVPKLNKGFHLFYNGIEQHVVYITKKAFRQWKRSICRSTYTLETVSEYLLQQDLFYKITNTQPFLEKMMLVLEIKQTTSMINFKYFNLNEHFSTQDFLYISNDFILIRSSNTMDTFDLWYHKYWVGHTTDLKTLTIKDPIFKQEIYDMLNTTNIPLQVKND
jgi:hypothetical protein